MGFLVDRMSVNLELPTTEGLKKLAPNKKPQNLIRPMRQIQNGIASQRIALGKDSRMERSYGNKYLSNSIFNGENCFSVEEKSVFSTIEDASKSAKKNDNVNSQQSDVRFFKKSSLEKNIDSSTGRIWREKVAMSDNTLQMENGMGSGVESKITLPSDFVQDTGKKARSQFVPAGQSTQMIIGASGESDFHLR